MPRKNRRTRLIELLRSRAFTVGLLVIAVAISLATGREVARRVAVQQELDRLTAEIEQEEESSKGLERLLATLRSSTFEEGSARTHLNLQKPGEKVLVVPEVTVGEGADTAVQQQDTPTTPPVVPNSRKWWDFIFTTSSS